MVQTGIEQGDTVTPSNSGADGTSRRTFLTRSAAVVGASSVAAVLPVALAGSASAAPAPAPVTTPPLPDFAPVPPSALGPAVNDQGYYTAQVKRNLYWVTDATYQSAFLLTRAGVVVFDAPPTIGNNLQRAINQMAAINGTTNKVTHLVYSHHHADHAGASALFGKNVIRIGSTAARELLLRDNDPTRPAPTVTFADHYTLRVGGERVNLAWRGSNHTPDNIYIHFPDHDTLMLVDIVNSGWVPIYNVNLSEDIPGYTAAPATALSYPWKHFIGGHVGRLGTRSDVLLHQSYIADIAANCQTALATVDPTPFFVKYGANGWAGVRTYLDAVTDYAAAPVIKKYTGVLAAADVYTTSTTLVILESIRLDLGVGSQIHP
jgi:glyoxylase-like metal-dependent hydrolase (beta-lactamase superfamily II)